MEDIQHLLHDQNCSNDVVEHIYNDIIESNRVKLNLIRDQPSIANQKSFRFSLQIKPINDVPKVTNVVFAVNSKFNFSYKDVHDLYNLILKDEKAVKCLTEFIVFFQPDFNDEIDITSYSFYAFIFAILMIRDKEMDNIYNLEYNKKDNDSSMKKIAYQVYTLLKPEMLVGLG